MTLLKQSFRRLTGRVFSDLNMRRVRASQSYRELVEREANAIRELRAAHATLHRTMQKSERLRLRERRVYSQAGEDGLLLYFFSAIGAPNKSFIEFGIEDGRECNAANLAINFGWRGLFLEGSPSLAERARAFYHVQHHLEPAIAQIEHQFVTCENCNELFLRFGYSGEIDLLSIDIDGNDYWIWKAINVISPRIVAIEYNASFGRDRSITVPYEASFDRYVKHPSGWYHGASLAALDKLAHQKGYFLAGCDSFGANAFFIRRDLAVPQIAEFSPEEAFHPSVPRLREASTEMQFEAIGSLPLVEI